MKDTKIVDKLLSLTEEATSPFHTVSAMERELREAGFAELGLGENWDLARGGKYMVIHHGSTLLAFTVGEDFGAGDTIRIAAAHGDFPGFRVKPNAEIYEEGYVRLNVEGYGGVNLASWLDRPLSLAGRVLLKSEDPFCPEVRLVDMKRPVLTIPNLAIHFNREMNKGVELNKQNHMLPFAGLGRKEDAEKGSLLKNLIAGKLRVSPDDILEYELNLYNTDAGDLVGFDEEFLSSPRLDNLTSVYALVSAITEGARMDGINVIAVFDHEEVGSHTKQGAGSTLLPHVLEKIYLSLGLTAMDYKNALTDSLLMSVDVAHGYHPAHSGKHDPTNRAVLNQGFCIKQACSQKYATDGEAIAIVQQICQQENIPYQRCLNHSDIVGGGTLGSIASAMVPVRTVDIGVPLISMHSSRELMGAEDEQSLIAFLKAYFSL